MDYTSTDIIETYRKLGVSQGRTVYVTGNFGRLGLYETKQKEKIFDAHFVALMQLLGTDGTLLFPTHSFSLCNSDTAFSVQKTPSETGPFTEYLRKKPSAVRQRHPFSSTCAIGSKATYYCNNNGLHVYDMQSPFHRMVKDDALFLSVGMLPQHSVSLVHYVEFMMGVPYRYVKEFPHIIEDDRDKVKKLNFYLHVLYKDILIERDKNIRIFKNFTHHSGVEKIQLGRSSVYSFNMKEFVNTTSELFSKNIYAWLSNSPDKDQRIYRK